MRNIFKKDKSKRIVEIDFIRGLLIWFMIVDHMFYDFFGILWRFFVPVNDFQYSFIDHLYYIGVDYWTWPVRIVTRFIIISIFFIISGISISFSRNSLKRGLITFGVGVGISLVLLIIGKAINETSLFVLFGPITCYGLSIIICSSLRLLFNKLNPNHIDDFKWIALSLGIAIVGLGVMFGCWKIKNDYGYPGPDPAGEITWSNAISVIIGKSQDTNAADWMPLFPYLGLMMIGTFIGETLYKEKKSYFKPLKSRPSNDAPTLEKVKYYGATLPYKGIKEVITFTGRYSIFFYLLHQVVLILILGIILLFMGFKLDIVL